MKKGFVLGLATGIVLTGASLALANSQIQAILNDQIKIKLDGQVQEFKDEKTNETQYPITYKDRTYLPLRTVANLVGIEVDYDAESNAALLKTKKGNLTGENNLVVNKIENIASAKIMADSKVITKDSLPEDLRKIVDIKVPTNMKLTMISEIYTKTDMSIEEFDTLHDYSFLFSSDDKAIKINACKIGNPLRDYFFQSSKDISKIEDVDVIITKYEDRFIVSFSNSGINYDIETNGLSLEEVVEVIKNVI